MENRSGFRKLVNRILHPIALVFIKIYFATPRSYNYKKIKAIVLPGVFFPHFTISTKLLLQFLEQKSLSGKSFLELGCGTGIISVLAALNGAEVLASDINPQAIKNVLLNAENNQVKINTCLSDLFAEIPSQNFDFIIINPPYYPKNPINLAENAWFCGEDFEYFTKLFSSISSFFNAHSEVFMILSEDCQIDYIKKMATIKGLKLTTVLEQKKCGEMNFIFRVEKSLL
jgi:release factor glutamine methyltransferase